MAGYRPDDDWPAVTDDSGNPMSGGWKLIVAFVGILFLVMVIGRLAHGAAWFVVGAASAAATFLACFLVYCLRMGVVGSRSGNVRRENQPIAYWMGIAALALLASFSIYILWLLVT